MTLRWPGVRVVDGPRVAGLRVDDLVAIELGLWIWRTGSLSVVPFWVGAIDVPADAEVAAPAAFLAEASGWRTREELPLGGGSLLDSGPWRLELVDDVGALPGLRRVDGMVLARPAGFRLNPLGEVGSVWLLVSDPASCVVVWDSGRVQKIPRWSGTPLPLQAGILDVGRAKAIAAAVPEQGAASGVALGFDGAVVWKELGRRRRSRLEHFCRLIGQPLVWERDRDEAQRLYDDAEACAVDDIAALARSIDPVGWQRESELREECAIARHF